MKQPARATRHGVVALFVFLFIAGCALIGGFSAKSHEQLTSLKAAHMKFIDVFTEGEGRSFDAKRLIDEADKVDLKFREALEFSKSLDDKPRTANIELLKSIFEDDDLRSIRNKNALLNSTQAGVLKDASSLAYERALKGECARAGANCK